MRRRRSDGGIIGVVAGVAAGCIMCTLPVNLAVAQSEPSVSVPPPERADRSRRSGSQGSEAEGSDSAVGTLPGAAPTEAWTEDEIATARASCFQLLSSVVASYDIVDPIREGRCGTPAPVRLKSIGSSPAVAITPPATVNCPMVVALHTWMEERVQRAARETLGSAVKEIRNVASYSCRNRYSALNTRISEHAFANALDIAGFQLNDETAIDLLADWGPTERELAAAREAAAQSVVEAPEAPAETTARGEALALTPEQALEVARIDVDLARARLALAERLVELGQRQQTRDSAQQTLVATQRAPIEPTGQAGDGRRRSRTRARASVIDVPPPVQNPGRTTIDRARREADRNSARIQAAEDRRRQQEAARAAAEGRKARAVARAQRRVARVQRRVDQAQQQVERARQRVERIIQTRETLIAGFSNAVRIAGASAGGAGRGGGGGNGDVVATPVASESAKARFLRTVHAAACGVFGTVLGPEANDAHKNHFHLDLAERRRSAYCE